MEKTEPTEIVEEVQYIEGLSLHHWPGGRQYYSSTKSLWDAAVFLVLEDNCQIKLSGSLRRVYAEIGLNNWHKLTSLYTRGLWVC